MNVLLFQDSQPFYDVGPRYVHGMLTLVENIHEWDKTNSSGKICACQTEFIKISEYLLTSIPFVNDQGNVIVSNIKNTTSTLRLSSVNVVCFPCCFMYVFLTVAIHCTLFLLYLCLFFYRYLGSQGTGILKPIDAYFPEGDDNDNSNSSTRENVYNCAMNILEIYVILAAIKTLVLFVTQEEERVLQQKQLKIWQTKQKY